VPKFRSDINSSIDIVGALYKILNFNCKISLTNDHISAFFEEIEDSSVQSYDFLKKKHDDINQYDENSLFNSFEIQKETQNIQLLHDGENNLNQIFYEAFKKLSYLGFGEVLHFSFIDDSKLQKFFDQKNIIKLKSAINKTLISLRPNLFVGLLEKYKEIIKTKKDESILLFEHGPIFWKENPFSKVITGVMGGKKFEKNPHLPVSYFSENNFFDFFDAKSSLLSALESLNLKEENLEFFPLDEFYQEKKKFSEFHKLLIEKKIVTNEGLDLHEKFLHPLRCAIIFAKIHEKKNSLIKYIFIGYCGEFNPFFLEEFDLNDEGHDKIANFVIFKDALEEIYLEKESLKYELFRSDFQAIQRDFALIFDENISISMIKNNIMENSKSHPKLQNIIHDLKIFDIFQNDELAKQNKKSVGFSFKICSNVKTFKDQEVKEITTIILEKIKLELGGVFAFEM
jgi:phenylalanyl-tRNA synthetase beta subunit